MENLFLKRNIDQCLITQIAVLTKGPSFIIRAVIYFVT